MLLTAGPLKPDSDKYAFEVKWDGFRALISTSRRGVKIMSRNGNDMTARYPELQSVSRRDLLLDGEIVCLDDDGIPDFDALWSRSRGANKPAVCFMAFDLLRHGTKDLVDLGYRDRRKRLEALDLNGAFWCTPPSYIGDGAVLFQTTKERGLEGVVAKRVDSRYRPGIRSRSWTKTKHMQTRTFALLGWVPPDEWRRDRGCIVVGLRSGPAIRMVGTVESGYGRDLVDRIPELTRADLRRLRDQPWDGDEPVTGRVKFLEWTPAGGLRHATLMLR